MNKAPRIGLPRPTTSDEAPLGSPVYRRMIKPLVDIPAGLALSVITLPVVLVLILGAGIVFGGSGLERRTRVGKGGKQFNLYRVRTSRPRSHDVRGRRRRLANLLRRWSLDELPQLWNVMFGQMSLVGPRPLSPEQVDTLEDWQLRRNEVKPGLTGLWQVEARGDGRRLLDNLHYDIRYIDQLSWTTDLRILALTLGVWTLRREGQDLDSAQRRPSHRRVNHSRLVGTDLLLWPIALTVATYTRFDFSLSDIAWDRMFVAWALAVSGQLLWGLAVGLYRGHWRLGSFEEAARVGIGVALITTGLMIMASITSGFLPRGAIAAAGVLYLTGAFALRYTARAVYTRRHRSGHQRSGRLIVFGAGRAGAEAVEAIQRDAGAELEPVAFLDDDRSKRGTTHMGLPVVGTRAAIDEAAWRYHADSMLVAMPSASTDQIEQIGRLATNAGLQVDVLPSLTQSLSSLLIEHAHSADSPRPVYRDATPPSEASFPTSREFDLAVVGLGYVGLPTAVQASKAGLRVAGLDIDPSKVEALASGQSYTEDVTDAELTAALNAGFVPTTDPSLLGAADLISISVPTPLRDGLPDLGAVIAASEAIGNHLNQGQTVVLESTTYPGTTDEVVRPILERISGLTAGSDFYLAYAPERIDPGNPEWGIHNTPKLIGGFNEVSAERAAQVYGKFAPVVLVAGTREAEMAKLLENTYRHVNIALVNELAVFSDLLGVDIWETIRGAATKPFGFQPFYPGPGVGGHCIPIDPSYLSYRVRQLGSQFEMIELAQEINEYMPNYVARRAIDLLEGSGIAVSGATVLLLGVAYKPNIGDVRETPATQVVRALEAGGIGVSFSDPLVEDFIVDDQPVRRVADPMTGARESDLVIIHTPHRAFDLAGICAAARQVLDTRGVTSRDQAVRL